MDVVSACGAASVSDKAYYGWRRKYGRMNRARLSKMKNLEKENQRLKKGVADLELDTLILKETLDYLKPRALAYRHSDMRLFIPAKSLAFPSGRPVQ